MSTREPLARISSVRTKLGLLVAGSVVVATLVGTLGTEAGVPLWIALPVTAAIAVAVARWLATGLTTPLRDMTEAATRMAAGDYAVHITARTHDEVGELAQAFTRMAQDLAEADSQRRRLVATVAHELRTPLTAQQALLDNLVDGVVRPDDDALRTALAQSERLGALVGDLLDLSREDGRGRRLRLQDVAVAELLDAAVAEAELQGRRVRLTTVVDPPALRVRVDPGRLAQVVANLLDNAVRHSPADGLITLEAAVAGDRWTLTVTDEGPGISLEQAERLFQRFGSGGDGGGGTGLGLAIAAWVAQLHGGAMSALPAGDSPGARLRLTLPRSPADPAAIDPPSTGSTRPAEETVMPVGPPAPRRLPAPAPPAATTAPSSTPGPAPSTAPTPVTTPRRPGDGPLARRWWPELDSTPRPWLVGASLAIGALGALLLPEHPLGLGLLVVTWVTGGLMWWLSPRRRHAWSVAAAVVAIALSLPLVLRAAPAYPLLCLLAGGVLGAMSCTGARTPSGVVFSALAWPLSALRGLPLLDRSLRALGSSRSLWPVVRTVALTVTLALVFGGLLASADAVLGSWAGQLLPTLSDHLVARVFVLVFVSGIAACGLYLAINPPQADALADPPVLGQQPEPRAVSPREWLWPLGVVIAVFVAFLAAQSVALVGGHEYVLQTTGLSYAEYARQGFGQLTVTTLLVLGVVTLLPRLAPPATPEQRQLQRTLLAVLLVLSLVVVASALRRMALYQDAYGWSTLRLTAVLAEVWLGLIVLASLVALWAPWRRWVPRTAALTGGVLLAGYVLANPAGIVAEQSIARYEATGAIDPLYLRALGDDAAPTIAASDLPADLKRCILGDPGDLRLTSGVGELNLARSRGQAARAPFALSEADLGCVERGERTSA